MKVLIVLVLLVGFIGCEETTQELTRDYKCDICLDGAQFTRENIDMDLDVIWLGIIFKNIIVNFSWQNDKQNSSAFSGSQR
jgi:hypothetical protein